VKPPGEETPGKEEIPPPVDAHVQTMAGETVQVPGVVSIADVRAALEANLGYDVCLFQTGNEHALGNDVKLADLVGAPSDSPLAFQAVLRVDGGLRE
jgi:hypothetical protein